jgi:hypothetical protein
MLTYPRVLSIFIQIVKSFLMIGFVVQVATIIRIKRPSARRELLLRTSESLVRVVLSSFRFLSSTYPRSKALPWNALPSRLRLALAMLLQLRRQEPPLYCVPRRSQGTSAKNRKELPVFGTSLRVALDKSDVVQNKSETTFGLKVLRNRQFRFDCSNL